MKKIPQILQESLFNILGRFSGNNPLRDSSRTEQPLRAELLSADQMEQHGKALAGMHELKSGRPRDRLLGRLAENERFLLEVHHLLTEDVNADRRITPAGEWLLDNFHLIEEQIRTARVQLPKGYSKELPYLQTGPSAGLPRVYDIALETISHGDGRVDPESLKRFVASYLSVTTLKLGELWAIPIMLRLALIENLRLIAAWIVSSRMDRNIAESWADKLTNIAIKNPKNLIIATADMARSNPPMVSSFVAELMRRLQGQGAGLTLPLTWVGQQLSDAGQTIEQLVHSENQQQTMNQVSMSNSIGSLRFLSAMNWRDFVEDLSLVESILTEDPARVYHRMDFATRDHYRHVIEKIAKNSPYSESEVSRKAIELASPNAHVGFYLIDEGLPQLQQSAEVRLSFAERVRGVGARFSWPLYAGAIFMMSLLLAWGLTAKEYADGVPVFAIGLLGLLLFLCASQLAVAVANLFVTLFAIPKPLPRMDFSKGIPEEQRTLVVVPTMLTSTQNIEDLIRGLEVRFLANRENQLLFGLLTDFRDAEEEHRPEDEALLQLAQCRIEELNQKYQDHKITPFFLFHRPRRWNPQERIWMGYERKRGKIAELNGFLRGGSNDCFSLVVGQTGALSGVTYVITLDTDTQLARESARQFIGAMAHPLNHARYAILQPRVAVSLSGSSRSRYARLWTSETGIDPYTRAVSDVYQDLFDEGSFIGKGIYNVDAFEKALKGRFPENRILSHDLLEGCYAKAGLLSDVQLYEEYPSSYSADVSRRHRWIRGDWQIAQWVMFRVPGPDGSMEKNPLSPLSRWKILDNLRRSLTAPALTLLLVSGWIYSPSPLFWTLSVMGITLIPSGVTAALDVLKKHSHITFAQHLIAAMHSSVKRLSQDAFTFACLPYESFFSLDAVIRTIWRLGVTRKNMLEWNPSSNAHHGTGTALIDSFRTMWVAPVTAVLAAGLLVATRTPSVWAIAFPILVLWFFSPAMAWWISQPLVNRRAVLTKEETFFLRKVARKTWGFFETFVGDDDNWLPPDNYQEQPVAVIAHRTSPTNMGLALLANLAAYDFGYIPAGQLLDRTTKTLNAMGSLERYCGHFYNWYDTQSMRPLRPHYISSVDSGNLAGHLLTLQPGLLALPNDPILGKPFFEGLNDTLGVLIDAFSTLHVAFPLKLSTLQQELEGVLSSQPVTLPILNSCLDHLEKTAAAVVAEVEAIESNQESLLIRWSHAFASQCRAALEELAFFDLRVRGFPEDVTDDPHLQEIPTLRELVTWEGTLTAQRAEERMAIIEGIALQCDALAQMEYDFLYDDTRHQLAIGYNVDEHRLDDSYYDLLASEARLALFVAISQGQLPQESWFALGRLLTSVGGDALLLSWSGSMFEYLMPLLVMPTYENTLLDETYNVAVGRQIEYGKIRSVPWGVSESGFYAFDVHLNYQYQAFGVPGLGIKRGLVKDLVIAPYATVMALMVLPKEACSNLKRLTAGGFEGRYGFYEAIDYTSSRLPRGQSNAIIRSFMAHHQGMSFLSIGHQLLNAPMQKRFSSNPLFQATLLLLQEQIPKNTATYAYTAEFSDRSMAFRPEEMAIRVFNTPETLNPEVQLLSNGRYHVMMTNAGGGYSRWKDLSITRWREDRTCDNWGTFCYLRDMSSHLFWSTAYQPTLQKSDSFEAVFSEGRAEFRVHNYDYETYTEIAVSPEDDIELRRIRITNRARTLRTIEVTSYAEVVLAPFAADALHPAFSNLFVQTEIIRPQGAILCTRRPRTQEEVVPWMFHMMAVHGAEAGEISYETDRAQFIGRGNTVANPQALAWKDEVDSGRLSDSEGAVLDPIASIRRSITLKPGESVTINLVSGVAETREAALSLVEKYQDRRLADRVFDLAWTHGQVLLRQINVSEDDAPLYGKLAGSILYANASLRADPSILMRNHRGQSGLWGYSISGDLPIVLLRIENSDNIELVHQLVQAHTYWRLKGLAVDLVIWNEDHAGYRQLLHERILGLISAGAESSEINRPGGIFVMSSDQIAEEDRVLIQSVARVIIADGRGALEDQIQGISIPELKIPLFVMTRRHRSDPIPASPLPRLDLVFYNGLGGFTPDGREYVITTTQERRTPAPWVNVLANPNFGTVISESGLATTWSENAHEFRLTPWGNDPVSDSCGEAFYLRDEERGHFWSPTPLPCCGTTPYITRHGFGYSVFEHTERGICSELCVYVAMDAPVKFAVLKVRNVSERPRRISATGYVEWVLGDLRSKSAMHVDTEIDLNSGALFARNPYNTEFLDRTAFFDVDDPKRTVSGDRTEFIGRNGTLRDPAAMRRTRLSGKVGAALDPCAVIQVSFDLAVGEEQEVIFRLGVGQNTEDAGNLVQRFRGSAAARAALDVVWQHWTHTLGAVNVETPDPSLNILVNGWLLYQVIVCRLWARNATYQSGGAFGFRDQLQDVMALVHSRPHLVREHLLVCAAHQFVEGDVQHWWHPPIGRGVRTHCSDDYLWLPLAVCRYVLSSGDTGVLDEPIYFLQGRPLNPGEDSYYDLPWRSDEVASLYEHCVRAIKYGLKFGAHGLPLMGSGDWNDGMDLVGAKGKGESVWLGFFLYDVLTCFAKIARIHGDAPFAAYCEREAVTLRGNIEKNGWDGGWYRRAYFDDGSPLGSESNPECKIDSIAQSWSVLSGAGEPERSNKGMAALNERLVRRDSGLIQLFDPPFDKSAMNPGYIKGYVPGVRENGGQYTHAAVWAVMAFAKMGDNRRAWELFNMINPVNHGKSAEEIAIYKVEPYVVAADVYAVSPHSGRGGWTWYTGSAAWMYRLILESLLGLKLEEGRLSIAPCIPADWDGFTVHYRYHETVYHIVVRQISGGSGALSVVLDGVDQPTGDILLSDDRREHSVEVRIPIVRV